MLASLLGTSVLAAQSAPSPRALAIEDWYRLRTVSAPQLSPNGKWVAYTVTSRVDDTNTDPTELWLAATHHRSRRRSRTALFLPRWSIGAVYAAALHQCRDRPQDTRRWRDRSCGRPAAGGPERLLTADWDLVPDNATWSPDGRHVYFSAAIAGASHLFRVPVSGGPVEQVTSGARRLAGISFDSAFTQIA